MTKIVVTFDTYTLEKLDFLMKTNKFESFTDAATKSINSMLFLIEQSNLGKDLFIEKTLANGKKEEVKLKLNV